MYVSYVKIHMFTAGADVLGCYKSDRLWFLFKGRNQSLYCFPTFHSVKGECLRENKRSKGIFIKKWMEIPFPSRNVLK